MKLTAWITCPSCGSDDEISGYVYAGRPYTIGEFGPRHAVFCDPPEVALLDMTCSGCGADLETLATDALVARWEDVQ